MSSPADPLGGRQPLSDALRVRLDDVLQRVPSAKRGAATVAVTRAGVEAELGVRRPLGRGLEFSGSGYAGKLWGGGWDAGVRAAILW